MKGHIMKSVVIALIFCIAISIAVAEPISTTGMISGVIVYRGQALVTRLLDLDLPQGNSEVIVQSLPNNILPESLFAQASSNLTVLSVRYREKAVSEDTRPEVKEIDVKIEELNKNIRHAEQERQLTNEYTTALGKLENFQIAAVGSDVNRGLLQFEPLKSLTDYIQTKRGEYSKLAIEQDDKVLALKKELDLLQRKRQELVAGKSLTEREAVLYLNKADANKAKLELNYMVNNANWMPQYNLRANSAAATVLIEHNAIIHQASGEDWTNVVMTLSTAQPTLAAASPFIEPLPITIAPPPPASVAHSIPAQEQMGAGGMAANEPQYIDRTDDFKRLMESRKEEAKKGKTAQVALNSLAVSNQMMEVRADAAVAREIKKQAAQVARTEGVSVSYAIPGKLTLPSRSDQQLVTITTATTKVAFTHIATPLLTDYVYVQGELTNDSATIFLPGQAAMYRDNEFVGNGSMELVTTGEKFTMGFGIDSQVQVRRELEDKKTDIGWRARSDRSLYRIAINNYRSTPVTLQLFDRIPYTENPDIRIELADPSLPLSKDAEYLRTARKKGILRWDMKLAPNTVDDKATVVTYSVMMEYPRDMQIRSGK